MGGDRYPRTAMASVNVELKARDPEPDATAARCVALGAEDRGVLVQRDTYFAARHGRLKLRQSGQGDDELIAYRRPDAAEPAESAYVRAAIREAETVGEALEAALGRVVVVAKRRHLFIWENVRIHLDGSGLARARAKVNMLRDELAIGDDALVAEGYCDLLLDWSQALLRATDRHARRAAAGRVQTEELEA